MKEGKFPPTRKPLHWQKRMLVGGKLRSHGGEHSNSGAEGKAERSPDRGSVPTSTHQPKRRWGLGAEARVSQVRSQGEDCSWLREHSLKGASAQQLAGREPGEKVWSCRRGKRRLFWGAQ